MCTFGVLGLKAAGVAHPRAQTCKIFPSKKNHQNSTRTHSERHKKSEIVAGEGKTERNFGQTGGGGSSGGGGPAEGGPGKSRLRGVRPNLGRTHENLEHPPHRHPPTPHTTQSNTTQQQQIPHKVVWAREVPRKKVHGSKNKT